MVTVPKYHLTAESIKLINERARQHMAELHKAREQRRRVLQTLSEVKEQKPIGER